MPATAPGRTGLLRIVMRLEPLLPLTHSKAAQARIQQCSARKIWSWRSAYSPPFSHSVLDIGTLAAQEPHPKAASNDHPATTAAEPGHAPAAPANPMKPEPTLAIWTLVVFLGLLAVLTRFAWKPLIHALHEREKHLEHVLMETERARQRKRITALRAPQANGPGRGRSAGIA